MSFFENVTPESVDIHREGIVHFLEATEKNGLEVHGFKVIRHGKCCASAWYEPYGEEYLHPVYSFSKSLTSTAIGFAWQEKLLTLDEKIVDIFPEYCPEEISENLSKVTIHHLLTMSCGQETQIKTCDTSPDWIREFLHHPFLHEPGTFYYYNTPGTNMLSAIISRKTGQDLLEYLRPRLLEPLGIDQISCYRLKDEMQTCHGGGGMKLTIEGMARFTYFMLHKGEWQGQKLLNGWYEMMGQKQIETLGDSEGHIKEWGNGYGYQCWIGSLPDSFRADGAFGQFGFVFPSLDLIVITTAATEQTQTLIDTMYEHLIAGVCPDRSLAKENLSTAVVNDESNDSINDHITNPINAHIANPINDQALADFLCSRKVRPLVSCHNPEIEKRLEGRRFISEEAEKDAGKMSNFQTLVGGAGLFDLSDETAITQMSFSFKEKEIIWNYIENGVENSLRCGLDSRFLSNCIDGIYYAASCGWRSLRALEIEIRRIDAISGVRLLFRFTENKVEIEADETLITFGGLGMHEKHLLPFFSVSQ